LNIMWHTILKNTSSVPCYETTKLEAKHVVKMEWNSVMEIS
jgi:hypothetical protein